MLIIFPCKLNNSVLLGRKFSARKMHLSLLVALAVVRSKVVVLLLMIYCLMCFPLFVGVLCLSFICYALLRVHSSFAIIMKRKRKLVALLLLSYRCIVTVNVPWPFLTLPWVGMQSVIVVFPGHNHLLLDLTPRLSGVSTCHLQIKNVKYFSLSLKMYFSNK